MARASVSEVDEREQESALSEQEMSMMRIAVAGTGGLARLIAHFIQQDTGHHVVLLSREVRLLRLGKSCLLSCRLSRLRLVLGEATT